MFPAHLHSRFRTKLAFDVSQSASASGAFSSAVGSFGCLNDRLPAAGGASFNGMQRAAYYHSIKALRRIQDPPALSARPSCRIFANGAFVCDHAVGCTVTVRQKRP